MTKIIIASGPAIIENNRVLLNKDVKDPFWKFCGGRIEDNDLNIKDTAIRRVKEEMGLDIEIYNKDPYFFYTEKESDNKKISVILIHFLAKRLNEVKPGIGTIEWRWISFNDLTKEDLAPNIVPTLKYFGFIK